MELRHLRYFLVLAEELHFGRAAARLEIEQPPLSRQIKDLERELGADLFHRTTKKVELTAAGAYLRLEAQKLLRQLEKVKGQARFIHSGAAGQVHIGYVGAAMHSLLPAILAALARKHPDIHTILHELTGEDQVAGLHATLIDVGFLRTPLKDPAIATLPVARETFSLVLPRGHRLSRARRLSPRDLAAEPFIGFSRACAPGMVDQITALCNRLGFSPRLVHETSQLHSVLRLVESGLGYAIVPSGVRSGCQLQVRFFELTDCPERAELSLAYVASRLTPLTQHLIDVAQAQAKI